MLIPSLRADVAINTFVFSGNIESSARLSRTVEFISKKEAIDTTTPTGKFMLTVFGAVAELEREYILQRQREGIAVAKQNGVYKGRKPIEHPKFNEVVGIWKRGDITAVEAMKRLDMKPSTFYRKAKKLDEIPGIEYVVEEISPKIKVTRVKITNEEGEKAIGKKKGNYITIDVNKINL